MSWVSSSTAACATTLVGRAARAAGAVRPAVVNDRCPRAGAAPRNICLRRHVVNIKVVKCLEYWVVKPSQSSAPTVGTIGSARRQAARRGQCRAASAPTSYHSATPLNPSAPARILGARFPVWLTGHERPPTVGRARARRGHHGGVCVVGVGVGRSCCSTTTFYSFFMSFLRSRVHSGCAEQLLCRWSHSVSTSSRLTLVSTFCRGVSKQVEWPQATLCASRSCT